MRLVDLRRDSSSVIAKTNHLDSVGAYIKTSRINQRWSLGFFTSLYFLIRNLSSKNAFLILRPNQGQGTIHQAPNRRHRLDRTDLSSRQGICPNRPQWLRNRIGPVYQPTTHRVSIHQTLITHLCKKPLLIIFLGLILVPRKPVGPSESN